MIDQDYADHERKPVIRFFDDRTILWNPCDAIASAKEFMEFGEREVRYPRIVAAFRRVGLSEQAEVGILATFIEWRQLVRVPPVVENDKARKAFRLIFLKEELVSEEQMLFQTGLGVHINDAGAKAFAFVRREGEATLTQFKAVTGLSGSAATAVVERLATRGLIERLGVGRRYALAENLKESPGQTDQTDVFADPATAQVGRLQGGLSTVQVEPLAELSKAHHAIMGCRTA